MRSTLPVPSSSPIPSSSGLSRGSPRKGFSLVELSIVLVILGLLTGGILAGQSLIRAAELRAVVAEYQRYMTAIGTFRDKYMALPGDMNNATRFWNRAENQTWCVTNSTAAVAAPGTCDGNGNGYVANPAAASQSGEVFQLWRQLALAGLIEGTYSGYAGTSGFYDAGIGTNVPSSKLGNAGWDVRYVGTFGGDSWAYAITYDNLLEFGGSTSANNPLHAPVLKPEEAWNIDTKLDDGRPAYGKVVARYWNNACATGGASASDLANSVYNLTNPAIACSLYFPRAF